MSPRHALPVRRVPRHAAGFRRHAVLRAIALGVTSVLAFGVAGAATAYNRLQNNITSADVEHLLGERPDEPTPDPTDPNKGVPVNILVMGSDTREGQEGVTNDKVDGQRSDTTILVHISAERDRVDLVSIPRDSLVDIPECLRSDGTSSRARSNEMFNAAFALGGQNGSVTDAAACTQKTVEAATGVYIHHFVVIDMAGFVTMVDALGGIPMDIPQPIRSRKARLDLDAGHQVLDGRTALGYARARTGEGLDGSDLGRIERQQMLLGATAQEVLRKNLLTDVPELLAFLNAAARSLTVSSKIAAIPDMAGLALSLQGISSENINFLTVPVAAAPSDPNRVVWTSEADDLWQALRDDVPLTTGEEETVPETTTDGSASASAPGPGTTDG